MLYQVDSPSATIQCNVKLGDGVVVEQRSLWKFSYGGAMGYLARAVCSIKELRYWRNTHIGCSCTITKGSVVPPFSRIPSGTIYGR